MHPGGMAGRQALGIAPHARHRLTRVGRGTQVGCRWSHTEFRILGTFDLVSVVTPKRIVTGVDAREIGDIHGELASLARKLSLGAIRRNRRTM